MLSVKNSDTIFLKVLMVASSFLVGGYHLVASCVLSFALLIFIIYKTLLKEEKLTLKIGLTITSVLLLAIAYLGVSVWAVDSGTAIYGFFKILPVALFSCVISSYDKSTRMELLETVPVTGVVNGVLSFGLSFIPGLSSYFLVAERLGGFFQSPNAFAIYCLAGIIVLLTSVKPDIKKWFMVIVLTILILLTGSRTVFIFMVITMAIFVFTLKNKKVKRNILLILAGALVLSGIVVVLTDSVQTVGRFLTISLNSSTFLGRLLYYKDALKVIFENPFGLGYYGYYFTQGSFQTGVYSVVFVHNAPLQFMLDVGIIPAVFFLVALAVSLFSKRTDFRQKILLLIVFGHSLFDFDLEFTAVFFVLVLAMDYEPFNLKAIPCNKILVTCISALLIMTSVYFGCVNTLNLFGKYKEVDKIYGHDTIAKMHLITTEENAGALVKYADEIIDENGYLAIAYDVKANDAYKNGDFKKVIEYKKKAIECAPYSLVEYIDYCDKLIVGASLYSGANDMASAEYCMKEFVKVESMLEDVKQKTSSLGWKIYDKPQLDLPEKYSEVVKQYKEN